LQYDMISYDSIVAEQEQSQVSRLCISVRVVVKGESATYW
jgi:hypothetical protein